MIGLLSDHSETVQRQFSFAYINKGLVHSLVTQQIQYCHNNDDTGSLVWNSQRFY